MSEKSPAPPPEQASAPKYGAERMSDEDLSQYLGLLPPALMRDDLVSSMFAPILAELRRARECEAALRAETTLRTKERDQQERSKHEANIRADKAEADAKTMADFIQALATFEDWVPSPPLEAAVERWRTRAGGEGEK